jgi:hypothetical protein
MEGSMQCDQLIDAVLAIGRVTVLILGMFAGTFSIYLGWRLYRDSVVSKTSGEINYKSVRIVLTAGGPGVFLAMFGAYLLVSITGHKMDLSSTTPVAVTLRSDRGDSFPAAFSFVALQSKPNSASTPPNGRREVPTPQLPKCLVVQQNRLLFEGAGPASSAEIRAALYLAIGSMKEQAKLANEQQKREIRGAIEIVEDLGAGVQE